MGVDVRIVVYAQNRNQAERACAAVFEKFAELDTIMSDYRDNSELMQLCAKAGGPPVPVSEELFRVLARSQELAQRSDGAFDITCSPIVRLWRTARKTHVLPTDLELANARAVVGWKNLVLDPDARTAQLLLPGMLLDLGGIGKGYANDLAQAVLRRHGIRCALVESGGDIVVTDSPPGTQGWRIQAQIHTDNLPKVDPSDGKTMLLANCAISTSGDTEQFVEIGGKRFSHIIDPRTGQALTNRIGVMVIARDGLTSDGLTKPISILGVERTRKLVKTYAGARIWVGHDSGDEKPTPRGDLRTP